jgi:outer membrane protein TolC
MRSRPLFQANPEYQAAQQQVQIAEREAALTKTELNPSVSVVGGYFLNSPSPFRSYGDAPIACVVGRFPFFDHTVTERVQQKLSEAEERRMELHQLEFDIGQGVQAAYLGIDDTKERIQATEAAIASAWKALHIEMLKYHLGREPIENLLDAQAALLTTQADYDQAVAGYTTAVAALQRETEIQFFAGGSTP